MFALTVMVLALVTQIFRFLVMLRHIAVRMTAVTAIALDFRHPHHANAVAVNGFTAFIPRSLPSPA